MVIVCVVAVVLSSASLVLILFPRSPDIPPYITTEQGQITRATFTVGNPNGVISAIFNDIGTTNITISTVFVNNVEQPTWTCYVNGVATTPATVPRYSDSGAVFNITTTVAAGSRYDIKLVSVKGNPFEYTGTAPS